MAGLNKSGAVFTNPKDQDHDINSSPKKKGNLEGIEKLNLDGGGAKKKIPLAKNYSPSESKEFEAKKAFALEEQARALAAQSKFYEATALLEQIPDIEEDGGIGIKLLMAECYVQLGRENKAMKAIKDVRKTLMATPPMDAETVLSVAEAYRSSTTFLRAMILLRLASEIFKASSLPPNDVIDGIFRCISLAMKAIRVVTKAGNGSSSGDDTEEQNLLKLLVKPEKYLQKLSEEGGLDPANLLKKMLKKSGDSGKVSESSRMRVIILDFGIEYMRDMLDDLRSVEGADQEKKTLKEAWATTHIGYILADLKEFGKSYKIRKEGCDAMERQFGANAGHYRIYGVLLHNMGVVMHNNQKYAEAEEIYRKALTAKEMAVDYDENERQGDIDVSRKALRNTLRHMQ